MALMRSRAVTGLTLLLLSPLLAACGDDEGETTKPGDVVRARTDDQFKEGNEEITVVLPTGRLLVSAGEPIDKAGSDDTRSRESVSAPSGAVLVPITWQYDPWSSGRLDSIFDTDDTPIVDLVSDGQDYRLPPPDSDSDAGESFYVVVDGDGEDRTLELGFDGVVQSVDLKSGDVEQGGAAGLYDVEDKKLKPKSCDEAGKWFDTKLATVEFGCDIVGPVLTPYAGGEWAPDGKLFMVMTLSTELRSYTLTNGIGGAARYAAGTVKVKATIDGQAPTSSVSNEDGTDACPIPASAICGWSHHLIFEVPADDGEQGPLTTEVTYGLVLGSAFGDFDPPNRDKVEAEEDIKIWD